ncbi:malto-oligosyltrehalose synthase [Terrihabitans sp. B22-R8]|uniref:malto-oligosyltrehalose synthase n=1 Tax=Terrihabitans sp. B22-R8 TaxID=3425128 RepID=UPI00403C0B48
MNEQDQLVERLAELVGIQPSYQDQNGKTLEASPEGKRRVLGGLGLRIGTEDELRSSIAEIEALRHGLVPPVIVAEAGHPLSVPLRDVTSGSMANWVLTDERGEQRDDRGLIEGRGLRLPSLEPGYYRLSVDAGEVHAEAHVIVAPKRCWTPSEMDEGDRFWGVSAQVYGLNSVRNLGMGDYTDVADAASGVAALGANFLGLSPLHALFASDRTKISPYSPSSRLFLESLFLDPAAIAEFAGSRAEEVLNSEDVQARLSQLHEGALIDHEAVWAVKRPLLDALFADFRAKGGDPAFDAFRAEWGEALENHALFEALSEQFRAEGLMWPGEWPDAIRNREPVALDAFCAEHGERILFHAWLQWQCDLQLAAAAERAREGGMSIGLYRDLAVGSDRGGSEYWSNPERFSPGLSVGAPPDPLGPQGQNWGLPPFDPLALERDGLAAFRALVQANMRHAGAIRIDHAFQLQRLFLIPEGSSAADGAYVSYPFEAMLAVLRLESHRNQCLVIAEDLGTGPEGFSDAIMDAGLLSYRVLFFEREGEAFKPPQAYPHEALAVFTTHDLPTLRGWWRGLDVDLRQTLGVFDHETSERERANRSREIAAFCRDLHAQGLLDDPSPPLEPPLDAIIRFLGRTRSALTAIQFEDAAGELNQANLPGLTDGHPNWKRRLSTDIDDLVAPGGQLSRWAAIMGEEGRSPRKSTARLAAPPPRATYRLQFHEHFTFDDAAKIVPYLARLGISHVYASPIAQARPGSTHGYDIVNHNAINPELGREEAFLRLSEVLKAHDLGLILDIVPNHMGVGGADNWPWLSMLEWGPLSPFAIAFDVDWQRLGANGKIVVPFLGSRYGDALENGELKVVFDAEEGSFSVWHYEHRFPVCPVEYPGLLDRALAALTEDDAESRAELVAVSESLRAMAIETEEARRAQFPAEAGLLKRRIAGAAKNAEVKQAIDRAVTLVNGVAGEPESVGGLHRLLEAQNYRLAHWRVAASDINYRRFFDINSLGGIRVENPQVFEATHEMIFRLVAEGHVQGLRIDHIDGLADPEAYARDLQNAVGPGFYVVIEKILEPGEKLRPWPVAGTTGYDVLNQIDGVFVAKENGERFENIYRDMSDLEGGYGASLRAAKEEILETSFASELEVLVSDLKRIADVDRKTRDYTIVALRRALVEIVARFPVYRTYIGPDGKVEEADRELLDVTITRAKRWSALPDRSVHDFIHAAMIGGIDTEGPGRPAPRDIARFRRRFQQLTGPVMAKSLEDTLFYRYARLISLNEVGGDPDHFGIDVAEFHEGNAERARDWPGSMIATATHDTKRGEDARARLSALSEVPDEWARALDEWREIAGDFLDRVEGWDAPDGNDQLMFLQAILGAWPLELLDGDDADEIADFRVRIQAYAEKAMREAKRFTSWVNNDEEYEKAVADFLDHLLAPGSTFFERFRPLARHLAQLGAVNSLSRTALKLTLPGVPDTYQGTEFWDFSLVDPDNRRPVDYAARARALEKMASPEDLLADWRSGRVKQFLTHRVLEDRAAQPAVYTEGDYAALDADGEKSPHVLAFTRTSGEEAILVAVPRLVASLVEGETVSLSPDAWADTRLTLPQGTWRDVLSGEERSGGSAVAAAELFAGFPVAVLRKVS